MGDDLDDLIGRLAWWQSIDYSRMPRDQRITKLWERDPDVVIPALIERLKDLLAATARHRERVAAVKEAWDTWYEESDRLTDEHGRFGVDIEPYRTIPTASLPQQSAEDEHYRDPFDLKHGIIGALRQFGDQRAAPLIITALADPTCVYVAAHALRDIRSDQAVPALLDAVASIEPDSDSNDFAFDALTETLRHYGVSIAQARERFEAETSPHGRVNLMRLLKSLPDDDTGRPAESQIKDSLIFLALDNRARSSRWKAIEALHKINGRALDRDPISDWDAPPSPEIIRSAIVLAAHGHPPGYDRELAHRIRRRKHTSSVAQAAEAILIQESPEPDAQELHLALRFAQEVRVSNLNDPMRLVRALNRLTCHPEVGDRALFTLRSGDLLFEQMVQDDAGRREEAWNIFQAIATPDDHARFASFNRSRPGRWSRLLRRFRHR